VSWDERIRSGVVGEERWDRRLIQELKIRCEKREVSFKLEANARDATRLERRKEDRKRGETYSSRTEGTGFQQVQKHSPISSSHPEVPQEHQRRVLVLPPTSDSVLIPSRTEREEEQRRTLLLLLRW